MARKSINMKPLFQEQDVVFYEEGGNDFSNWEFINESDADSDTDSLHSLENGFVSWPVPRSPKTSEEIVSQDTQQDQDVVFLVNSHDHEDDDDDDDGCVYRVKPILFPAVRVRYGNEVEDADDEDEEEDGYGLNDELVPWNVSGKVCSWKAWIGLEGLAEEEIEGKNVVGVEKNGIFEFGTVVDDWYGLSLRVCAWWGMGEVFDGIAWKDLSLKWVLVGS
ncbi:unnamed protein product [Dovyalis caffra]|uniref:Uncharacterized protein n=1 Tax=Dovyalis caffra TaxID=77055 RepID=A0AAV1RAW0_9ROSI|nr:unnamed protein product [Dovyalis caffra]